MTRHLVLAGAGHAHLDLLATVFRRPPSGWQVTLVTPEPDFSYSGMWPAIVAGDAAVSEAQVPIVRMARAAGVCVHEARVVALDSSAQSLTLDDGATLTFDILSLDVGSASADPTAIDGFGRHAWPLRPFARTLDMLASLDAHLRDARPGAVIPVIVAGAGAGGVEIAFAIRQRIRRAGRTPDVTLVDVSVTDGLPLPGFATRARHVAGRALDRRGIAVRGGRIVGVHADRVLVKSGATVISMPSIVTVLVSGSEAHAWLSSSGLRCDGGGRPLARATLALNDEQTIFGAGDCITLSDAPHTRKAGVYAVRMAPVLAHNVIAAATRRDDMQSFTPQRDFLALLNTGDGAAVLRWHGVALESRWALRLKAAIDRRYVQRWRDLTRIPRRGGSSAAP